MSETLIEPAPKVSARRLRERIILAARLRFLQQGMSATSLRQVARDAGTSVSTVCYHFSQKEALLAAVVEPELAELVSEIERHCLLPVPLEEHILWLSTRLDAASDAEREVLRIVVRELVEAPEAMYQLLRSSFDRLLGVLKGLVTQGYEEKKVNDTVHPLVAIACVASTVSAYHWVHQGSSLLPAWGDATANRASLDELQRSLLQRVFSGLSGKEAGHATAE